MNKESKEAFQIAINNRRRKHGHLFGLDLEDFWQAACEWQIGNDSEICLAIHHENGSGEGLAYDCANAILNQGDS